MLLLELSLGFVLSTVPLLSELLSGLLSGVGLFSGLLFPVFSLFPGFTSVELLLVLFEELFALSLAVLVLELSLGFVLSTVPLLFELLLGLLSGVGLFSGLLFPGTVSLSSLCLEYSSNALSMLDFSSKILSIDFSSSYTFWAFSVASFSLAYTSLLIPSLSLSSLTKILAVSKGKRRFALSVASFLATSSSVLSTGLLASLLLGVSTLSLGLLASLLVGVSTLSLGLLTSLLLGVSTLSLGLLVSLLLDASVLSLGLFTSGAGASFNPLTASSISFNKLERVSSRFLVSLALFMNSVALVIAVVKLFLDSSE